MPEVMPSEIRRRRRSLASIIHPLLFAAYPVLFLFANNIREQVTLNTLYGPLAVVVGGAAALLLIHWLLIRDMGRAGLVTTLFVVLFFSYGHAWSAVEGLFTQQRFLVLLWGGIALVGLASVARASAARVWSLTPGLNVIAVIAVAMSLGPIIEFQTRAYASGHTAGQLDLQASTEAVRRPDIYYIVLDRYAAESTLSALYGFNNSDFIDELERRGFYVADESRSNYLKTFNALVSTLEMDYLNAAALRREASHPADWKPLLTMVGEGLQVQRFLKSEGYTYVHVGSPYAPTAENSSADATYRYTAISEFSSVLYHSTMMRLAETGIGILPSADPRELHREHALYQFDRLAKIRDLGGPKFVFAHIGLPHPPYVFDRDGRWVTREEESARLDGELYIDQLSYTNKRVLELLDQLLSGPVETHPVVLLTADEGPYPLDFANDQANFDWDTATPEELHQKFAILHAYYLPRVQNQPDLYPSISPVNSFRVIFNAYFGTDLPLHPDRNYLFAADRIYDFVEVTDRIPRYIGEGIQRSATYESRVPTTWSAGETMTYDVTVRNVGAETWSASGPHPVRLSAQFGAEGQRAEQGGLESDIAGRGWIVERRFSLPRDVPTGASERIRIRMTAPQYSGDYVLRHQLVEEGITWFGQLDANSVTVLPALSPERIASYDSTMPTTWSTGETQAYEITVRNDGASTWPANGPNRVRLSVHFGNANDRPGHDWATEMRFDLPADLPSGSSATLSVTVTAPTRPGDYVLRHRMLQEDIAWFEQIEKVPVHVGRGTSAWLPLVRLPALAFGWFATVILLFTWLRPRRGWDRRPVLDRLGIPRPSDLARPEG